MGTSKSSRSNYRNRFCAICGKTLFKSTRGMQRHRKNCRERAKRLAGLPYKAVGERFDVVWLSQRILATSVDTSKPHPIKCGILGWHSGTSTAHHPSCRREIGTSGYGAGRA